MISFQHKCIFVHIPKTGGSSIEEIIWPERRTISHLYRGFIKPNHNKYQTGGLQHLFAKHIKLEVGEQTFDNFFKFSIVRNPWEKAISQYFYLKTPKTNSIRKHIGFSVNDSFKKYLTLIQKRIHVQWDQQYKFIYDHNGEQMVDFIGRFENFHQDVYKILKILNIENTLISHTRKTEHDHYSQYYDLESQQIVTELYQQDIKLFGYSFNEIS